MCRSWEIAWLACAFDSEGSLAISPKEKNGYWTVRPIGEINNSDAAYIEEATRILDKIGCSYSVYTRRTGPLSTKDINILNFRTQNGVLKVLIEMYPYLIIKKAFALSVIGLFGNHEFGVGWNDDEVLMAAAIRQVYMPRSTHGNGETLTSFEDALEQVSWAHELGREVLRAIPSEASGSMSSTEEPLESRPTSSASSNSAHECPASQQHLRVAGGEDVLRSSEKSERGDKELRKDIAR